MTHVLLVLRRNNPTTAKGEHRWAIWAVPVLLFVLVAQGAAAPSSGEVAAHPPVISHHVGRFNGKHVQYAATVESTDVPDAKGSPAVRVVCFTYTHDSVHDSAIRPVMFVFNGGPISASLWLHIGIMGPQRISIPDDLSADPNTYQLVDNVYSPLDVADLVFIDPASTGFSRVLPGTSP